MSRWATLSLFLAIFGLGALFRGDWVRLSTSGFALGFLIAVLGWQLDRQFRRLDGHSRWSVLKWWMVGGFLIAAIASGVAYWQSKQDALVSGAAVFLGVGLAALTCEMLARRRSLA